MAGESLLQVGPLMDFVMLVIWTGQLADERPISGIIVAPAGAGKTTILENLQCEQARFVGDFTARTASAIVRNDKVTHILLGDMLSLFAHRASTVKLSMAVVSKMTGEKLDVDPWSGENLQEPRMIGLITAIPPDDFKRHSKHINPGGFASRFLIVKYAYKASTIASIHRFISENKYSEKKTGNPFGIHNPGKIIVKIPAKVADHIKDFGMQIKRDPLGFRAHRHLRALVKAQARRNDRGECTQADFAVIESYCDFFTTEGKEI